MYPRTRRIIYSAAAALSPGPGDRAAQAQGAPPAAIVQFDPGLYPPEGSLPVILTDRIVNAPGGLSQFAIARKVDRTWVLNIDAAELLALAPVDATNATWTLTADGVPITGYVGLTMQFRAGASQSREFDKLRCKVRDGAVLGVLLNNIDGAARTYGIQLVGWTYKV